MIQVARIIGTGIVTIAFIGAGIGVGVVFSFALLISLGKNFTCKIQQFAGKWLCSIFAVPVSCLIWVRIIEGLFSNLNFNLNASISYNTLELGYLFSSGQEEGATDEHSPDIDSSQSSQGFNTLDQVAPSDDQYNEAHPSSPREPGSAWHPVLKDIEIMAQQSISAEDRLTKEGYNQVMDHIQNKLELYGTQNPDALSGDDLNTIKSQMKDWVCDNLESKGLYYKHAFYADDNDIRDEYPSAAEETVSSPGSEGTVASIAEVGASTEETTEITSHKRAREADSSSESESAAKKPFVQGPVLDDYADLSEQPYSFMDEDC